MLYSVIKAKAVRELVKANGKRCGNSFLQALDRYVVEKIQRCIKERNGGYKTLNAEIVSFTK